MMKKSLFLIMFCSMFLLSCNNNTTTERNRFAIDTIEHKHSYVYGGHRLPVMYSGAIAYYLYRNAWIEVPKHKYCNIQHHKTMKYHNRRMLYQLPPKPPHNTNKKIYRNRYRNYKRHF